MTFVGSRYVEFFEASIRVVYFCLVAEKPFVARQQ
jgi:hypothetical protein